MSAATEDPIQKRDELKRLKLVEMKLQHDIQELSAQRNGILVELQQLQECRPAMERTAAYAVSSNYTRRTSVCEVTASQRDM